VKKRTKDIIETLVYVFLGYLIAVGANYALSIAMDTDYPVVAVVSSSMEHNIEKSYHTWFIDRQYEEEEITSWKFKKGINKGDIVFVKGVPYEEIKIGDVIVYKIESGEPIIHRVIQKENGDTFTKGDNNMEVDQEGNIPIITEEYLQGRASFRIPFLGYVKIMFMTITGRG